jgi:hypothetical protein
MLIDSCVYCALSRVRTNRANTKCSSSMPRHSGNEEVDIIDVDVDPDEMPEPELLASMVDSAIWKAEWKVLITQTTRAERSEARKGFTTFIGAICHHPYMERFALTRKLTTEEKSKKKNAVFPLAHVLYYIFYGKFASNFRASCRRNPPSLSRLLRRRLRTR